MDSPQRMCMSCRRQYDKRDLIRIVRSGENIFVDKTFKAAGRGAYVCHNKECLQRLVKHKLLSKAFKCEVPPDVYAEIEAEYDR